MTELTATINKLVNKFDKFEVKKSNNNSQNSNTGNNNRNTSTNGSNNESWTPSTRFNGNNHSAETQRTSNTKKWYLTPPTNDTPNQIKNMIRHGIGVKSAISGYFIPHKSTRIIPTIRQISIQIRPLLLKHSYKMNLQQKKNSLSP